MPLASLRFARHAPAMPESAPIKAALVTGAAKRLGRAIALRLAAEGWDVALHCHSSLTEAEATATVGARLAVTDVSAPRSGSCCG